ncbi:MAG: RNA polymerase sigma factor [Bryobacterales bacterium]|nr:RNA polymerase sigma factor [Bryobacterales bacterium]MBV9401462.1 RNA polymerase sigma factor [Bryobacterales bacterium]
MEAVAALERDAQLMLQVREGDETSFALLLERHRGPVINFLYRMVQDRAVSEELAQEVFLRVYRSRASYEPAAKFTTWLFRIATHLALNALRDNQKAKGRRSLDHDFGEAIERHVADRQPTIEQELIRNTQLKEIRLAIEALPEKQRAAVLMHKYQGLEYAQIAQALQCSESAVKSLIFRAYQTLRSRLAHMAPGALQDTRTRQPGGAGDR